jgi:hypothetical protein
MILHQHVRHRSTLFQRGHGRFVKTKTLATNEWYYHILHRYNDEDLKTALNICKSARLGRAPSNCSTYKEVQIHGPVCLATDILALSIPGLYRTTGLKLKACVRNFRRQIAIFFGRKTFCIQRTVLLECAWQSGEANCPRSPHYEFSTQRMVHLHFFVVEETAFCEYIRNNNRKPSFFCGRRTKHK